MMGETATTVRRARRNPRKDPRLIAGIALVIGSMIIGALAFTAISATTPVLVATTDIAEGDVLRASDFAVTEVRIGDATDAYVADASQINDGALASRRIGEGEFLAKSAVGQTEESALRPVSVPLDDSLAASLVPGARVELWRAGADDDFGPRAVVEQATVRAVVKGGGLGMQGARVEVLVPSEAVSEVISATSAGDPLYVIEVPGQFEVFP